MEEKLPYYDYIELELALPIGDRIHEGDSRFLGNRVTWGILGR